MPPQLQAEAVAVMTNAFRHMESAETGYLERQASQPESIAAEVFVLS
jgi:hypothetical protein